MGIQAQSNGSVLLERDGRRRVKGSREDVLKPKGTAKADLKGCNDMLLTGRDVKVQITSRWKLALLLERDGRRA